jgi:hypothetical protein
MAKRLLSVSEVKEHLIENARLSGVMGFSYEASPSSLESFCLLSPDHITSANASGNFPSLSTYLEEAVKDNVRADKLETYGKNVAMDEGPNGARVMEELDKEMMKIGIEENFLRASMPIKASQRTCFMVKLY